MYYLHRLFALLAEACKPEEPNYYEQHKRLSEVLKKAREQDHRFKKTKEDPKVYPAGDDIWIKDANGKYDIQGKPPRVATIKAFSTPEKTPCK